MSQNARVYPHRGYLVYLIIKRGFVVEKDTSTCTGVLGDKPRLLPNHAGIDRRCKVTTANTAHQQLPSRRLRPGVSSFRGSADAFPAPPVRQSEIKI